MKTLITNNPRTALIAAVTTGLAVTGAGIYAFVKRSKKVEDVAPEATAETSKEETEA